MSVVVTRVVTRVDLYLGSEGGGSLFLRNVGIYLKVHTAFQPGRTTTTQRFKILVFKGKNPVT
jgi:hypothetical protein